MVTVEGINSTTAATGILQSRCFIQLFPSTHSANFSRRNEWLVRTQDGSLCYNASDAGGVACIRHIAQLCSSSDFQDFLTVETTLGHKISNRNSMNGQTSFLSWRRTRDCSENLSFSRESTGALFSDRFRFFSVYTFPLPGSMN